MFESWKEREFEKKMERFRTALQEKNTILIGAGAGLSTSAGFTYSGERFRKYFADFEQKYGFHDMYSGGFYPYDTLEEYWAYWSRYIYINRYQDAPKPVYQKLLSLMKNKSYFVITTNVDHCFQKAGFDKNRLFYTQGDYGLFQCSEPCCKEKYDNEEIIRKMLLAQGYQILEDGSLVPPENGNLSMRIPSELVPYCPHCGKPMSMNLLKAGNELVVFDFNETAVAEVVAAGAKGVKSGAEVATECDTIITMVPNSPHVRAACLGEGGIAEAAKPGTVVIDMSSIDPVESKKIGAELAEKGIELMDAPVSGGEPKAIDGTLSVMVGGKKETFDKYYELLMQMAGSVVYVGELGSGNVAKLANQVIVALNIAAVSEALTLAKKAGTDPELVYQAIRGGLAGSTVLDAKAPMMMDHNFKPGFRIELHIKDLNNALNAAHAVNASLPLTAEIMEIMQSLKADGNEKDDHSAIVKYYEKVSNVSVEREN